jgi:hypothetical protein
MRTIPQLSKDFAYYANTSYSSEFGDKKLNPNVGFSRIWICRDNTDEHIVNRSLPWTIDIVTSLRPMIGRCHYSNKNGSFRRDYYITEFGMFISVSDEIFARVTEGADVVDGFLWPKAEKIVQSLIDEDVVMGRGNPENYTHSSIYAFTEGEKERVRLLQEKHKQEQEEIRKRQDAKLAELRELIARTVSEEAVVDEIVKRIQYFDYYYDYSDDGEVSRRGFEYKKKLETLLKDNGLSWNIVVQYHTGK